MAFLFRPCLTGRVTGGIVRGWIRFGSGAATRSPPFVHLSEEVRTALSSNKPVVALESTVVSHGLPYPQNIRTALDVEAAVRENGATPATIALVRGRVFIGTSSEELEEIAQNKLGNIVKLSARDVPHAVAQGLSGGTTVSATAQMAAMVGIKVFATGGIGGVHRGGESSMDVSSDLTCLARTPMTIVSAGVKSILDIGRTLEYLETHGVCVTVWGLNRDFPAFLSPTSGHLAPSCVAGPKQAADLIEARDALGYCSGILLAVPPADPGSDQTQLIEDITKQILDQARIEGITGKDVTPFVLDKLHRATEGLTLEANSQVLLNNARVGSQVAVELSCRQSRRSQNKQTGMTSTRTGHVRKDVKPPVVIGGSVLDIVTSFATEEFQITGGTYPGHVALSSGGVGRNLADCLTRLGHAPLFISALGQDPFKRLLMDNFPLGMDLRGLRSVAESETARCTVVLDHRGDCLFCVGDMRVHQHVDKEWISLFEEDICHAPLVVVDGNIPLDSIKYIVSTCKKSQVPVWFEPTDVNKAGAVFRDDLWHGLTCASPNLRELKVMVQASSRTDDLPLLAENNFVEQEGCDMPALVRFSLPLMDHLQTLVVTMGPAGVLVLTRNKERFLSKFPEQGPVHAYHYKSLTDKEDEAQRIINVSGAGDCLAGAMMSSILRGLDLDGAVLAGLRAARLSLYSNSCIPDTIQAESVFSTEEAKSLDFLPTYISY